MKDETVQDIADAQIVDEPASNMPEPGSFAEKFLKLADLLDAFIKAHIIVAALLFPTPIKFSSQDNGGVGAIYRVWCLVFGIFLLVANLASIVALFSRMHLIDFAKVAFVVMAAWTSIIALIIVNQQKPLEAALFAIEEEAGQVRDESVMLIRAAQAGLKALNKKLYGEESKDHFQAVADLLKSVGPLAVLFLNKEQNMMRWGMAGMDFATKALKFAGKVFNQK
jgi:hypothetical protein